MITPASRRTPLLVLATLATGLALAVPGPPVAHAGTAPAAGQLLAFGQNTDAQLGTTPDNNAHSTPTVITIPGTGPVVSTAVSNLTSFVLNGLDIYGFGDNSDAQLAQTVSTGTNKYVKNPVKIVLPTGSGTPVAVTASQDFTLALTSTDTVYGWGLDGGGVLGRTPTNQANPTPTKIALPAGDGAAVQVSAGDSHVLIRTSTGRVLSLGDDYYGELGYPDPSGDNINPTPAPVTLPGNPTVTAISAGLSHSLVLTSDGKVYGFGDNREGELGTASAQATNSTPVLYPLPAGVTATQISAGSGFSLVLGSDGKVYASGVDTYGETGTSPFIATATTPTVVTMPAGAAPVLRISAAGIAGYALTDTGQIVAWGNNDGGELGTTSTAAASLPAVITNTGATIDTLPVGSSGRTVFALVCGLALTNTSLPAGQAGSAYSATATSTGGYAGGNISYSGTGLPAGLAISATGKISGTPTTAGTATVTLTATDVEGVLTSVTLPLPIAADPNAVNAPTVPPVTTPPAVAPPVAPNGLNPVIPNTVKAPSASAIIAALVANLVPRNKSASFAVLARHGFSQSVSALASGKVTITWTYLPHRGKKVTVATGTADFTHTGLGHVTVKLTKAGAALLKAGHKVGLVFSAAYTHGTQKLVGTKAGSLR